MSKPNKSFVLSTQGKLTLCVGLALAAGASAQAADIIATGSGPEVQSVNGITVVNINQANSQGLSHNTYEQYNVSSSGAVLNNSTVQGVSQLAGQLAANTRLNDTAASVILNEVVSKQPSNLLGTQEVFGQAADYVLANPNGITCDGCGFINTPTASLAVGTVELDLDKIEQFNTAGNNNTLKTRGNIRSDGNLNLVAPKLDIGGLITTDETVMIVGGHQTVNYDDPTQHTAIANTTDNNATAEPLDGRVFGSIQAGRIRIHHTDNSAELNLESAQLQATNDLAVQSAGTLNITGETTSTAGAKSSDSDYNWLTMVSTESSKDSNTQSYQGSRLKGDNISLSGQQAVNIVATDIDAQQDIAINGGDVNLDALVTENTTNSHEKTSKLSWFNQTDTSTSSQTVHSNQLDAGGNVSIHAGNHAKLTATQIKAGKAVNIHADKAVAIKGLFATQTSKTVNSYQNETASLKTGSRTQQSITQSLSTSTITAGSDMLISAETIEGSAVALSAQSIAINASDELRLEAQAMNNSQLDSEVFTYWGGVGGGETRITESKSVNNTQSTVNANNISLSGQNGIALKAVSLNSGGDIALSATNGTVDIKQASDYQQTAKNDRHGTAFNITDKNSKSAIDSATTLSSTLTAAGNIDIRGEDISITASQLSAQQSLNMTAEENIATDIATAQHTTSSETFYIGNSTYTKANGKTLQGEAGAKLQGITKTTIKGTGTTTSNSMTAANVNIRGGKQVDLKGSQIQASAVLDGQGQVAISGEQVSVGAGLSRTDTQIDHVKANGASIYVKGSLEKIAVGITIGTEQTRQVAVSDKAVKTTIQGQGVSVKAEDKLISQGTDITSSTELELSGKVVENLGAHDITQTHKIDANGGVRLEAYASVSPEVGVALTLSGEGQGTKGVVKQAQTDNFQAKIINLNATDSVTDTGTHYKAETVNIQANNYTGKAAQNSNIARTNTGMGELGLTVTTSDFASVGITASAAAEYQHLEVGKTTAVLGQIDADNITINARNDLKTSMNMTADDSLNLVAGNTAMIEQADNRQWAKRYGFEASGSLGVNYVPAANVVSPSFSVSGGGNYSAADDTQAVVSKLSAKNINAQAANHVSVEGATLTATDKVNVTAKQVSIDAATDTHKALGVKADANASLSLTVGNTVTGGSFGLGANFAIVKEESEVKHGANITANSITLSATETQNAPDLLVSGTTLKADTISISNVGGRVLVTAAENFVKKGNWGIGGNIGMSASKNSAKVTKIGGHLDVDWENSTSYEVGSMTANTVNLTAGQDTTLQTDIKAGTINGNIGGDLSIASAQDHKHAFSFNTSAYFSGTPHEYDADTTVADIAQNIHNDYQNGTVFGIKAGVGLNLQSNDTKTTQVSSIDADTMNWTIGGGDVRVTGAQVTSGGGSNFGTAEVTQSSMTDYTHDLGVDVSLATPNFKSMFTQIITGREVESPVTADGHLNWTDDKTVAASVKLK